MATYYVKPASQGGSNSANGLSAATAWATVAYALTSASGFASGDTLYVAPGIYTDTISVTITNPTAETNIIGNPTANLFSGINPAPVVITNYNSSLSASGYTGNLVSATTKDYLHFRNIQFKNDNSGLGFTTCRYTKFTNCSFITRQRNRATLIMSSPSGQPVNTAITNCVFIGGQNALSITGQNVADGSTITNTLFIGTTDICVSLTSVQVAIMNCTIALSIEAVVSTAGSTTYPVTVRNTLCAYNSTCLRCSVTASTIVENYNRLLGATARANVADNGTSATGGDYGFDTFDSLLVGLNNLQPFTTFANSPNYNFGNTTGAPATDMYGVTWTGTNPDAGSATYRAVGGVGIYQPTERNASTITIAPGSTSQSIELYLGATGLTASTSGLSARYNRTRTASVSIPLVARTIAQAWTAGGFAEVDATNMPGVYRLDIPDAALAAGADDVTVVVRGASGTNGAVMTVKLSSGGLTEAQTASAVWGASPAGYGDATTFGGVVNQIDNTTNGIDAEVQDIPSNVWEELRTNHTTAGSFGQYVNAELVTPVTSAALVRMGPFEVKADGLGASDPLDIQKGAQHGIDIQCVDNNGAGIDITSATVTAKVYNSGATLVDTYSCTATYAADGRATFTIDTTVTNTPGTYTATITRTTGASDTQVFGPLRIYVRDI